MTLAGIEPSEILDSLRDTGLSLPARSATLLVRLARWYSKAFGNEDLAHDPAARKLTGRREELAAINGVGLATADAILLALGQPVYPLDRGTYRILVRHGWIDSATEYDQASELLSRQAGGEPRGDRPPLDLARAGRPPVLRSAVAQVPALSVALRPARRRPAGT